MYEPSSERLMLFCDSSLMRRTNAVSASKWPLWKSRYITACDIVSKPEYRVS
jgi:hypothetical protein